MKHLHDYKDQVWYRLDNAAKIYPAVKSTKRTNVFRLSAVLKKPIDPNILKQALIIILPRFPSFTVKMHRGLFWYYMEHNHKIPEIKEDIGSPCTYMNWKDNNGFLFKVLYYNKRISVEIFHSLTDGSGGMEFLKSLCAQYLRIDGCDIEKDDRLLDVDSSPLPEEIQDAFLKYAEKGLSGFKRESNAYHPAGTPESSGIIHVTTGIINVDDLLAAAHSVNVSITEYLVSVFMYVTYMKQKENSDSRIKPIRISVPVNLRKLFKSRTLRNFSSYVNPVIDPKFGDYSFEEIVHQVHHFMRLFINNKFLKAQLSANVSAERNILMRITPLFVKNISMVIAFNLLGDSMVSATLTNLGRVDVPDNMAKQIDRFEALIGSSLIKPVNCAVVSHLNTLAISFTRAIVESDIEREFFRFLVRKGLHVKIESNDA